MLLCIQASWFLFNLCWYHLECHAVDPHPIVQVFAADALLECLVILVEHQR